MPRVLQLREIGFVAAPDKLRRAMLSLTVHTLTFSTSSSYCTQGHDAHPKLTMQRATTTNTRTRPHKLEASAERTQSAHRSMNGTLVKQMQPQTTHNAEVPLRPVKKNNF